MLATDGTRAQVLIASLLVGLALGAFLVVRRAAGYLTSPLPPLQLLATAIVLLVCLIAIQTLATSRKRVAVWLSLPTLLLFAVACSYPLNRPIDWLVWVPAMVTVGWCSHRIGPARRTAPPSEPRPPSGLVLQQLTRYRTPQGNEAIRGILAAEFVAGQREATLYVAFCPPFERLPDVQAQLTDEPTATVKVAQRLHNGAQLDVRLAEPAEDPLVVSVDLFAGELEAGQ